MDIFDLAVQKRELTGSRRVRNLRRGGSVPAVVYGHGISPVLLEVKKGDIQRALHTKAGENVILNLEVKSGKLEESTCIIKDLQHHPVSGEIQHVDFTLISLKEKIEVSVPLVVKSADVAVGVKEGGILDVVHHELRIECLPTQIPEHFEVDIKDFKIGDALHVREIKMPEGVSCLLEPDDVVVAIHAPKKEEEVVPAEGVEAAQPEVIEKGKKVEAEEKGAEAEEKPKKGPEPKKPEGS